MCKTFVGGNAFEINTCGKEGWRRKQDWEEEKLSCNAILRKISPFPKGCFGVGRLFWAVQIESREQAFIPELNGPWMPLEVGVNRQGSFLQQRKTPKEANPWRLLDRGAPSFLGEWVLPFCGEIWSASEHLSSHAWLSLQTSRPFVCYFFHLETSCLLFISYVFSTGNLLPD